MGTKGLIPFAPFDSKNRLSEISAHFLQAPFVDVPNHPLPPTFSCTHHGFTANFESFVEYRLEAKLTRPPESYIIHSFGLESGLSLTYSPPRSVESPNPELLRTMRICTAQSLLLLPENEGRSLTFKEKTKSLFNSSQLPSSIFRLTVEQPSQICTGGRCPFFIGIEHLLEKSTAPAIPVVKLRKFTLTARAITSVRAQGHLFGSPTDTSEDKIYLDTRSNLNIPVTERMDLSKIFSTRFNSNALPPTFTTYNIARTYSLDFKIVVQCADKDFDLECGGLPLRVLPAIYHPPNDNTGRSQDLSEQSGGVPQMTEPHLGGPADEPLPRYEPPAYSVDGGPTGANGTAPAIDFGDVKRSHHLKNGDMQI